MILFKVLTLRSRIIPSHNAMRFSPILLISAICLVSATALAVPFVMRPSPLAQNSPSEQSDPSTHVSNPSRRNRGGILQKLNLTRDQFKQISAARKKYQPLIQDQARTVRTLQAKFRIMMASSVEPSEVKATFQELQKRRQELQQLRFDSSLATRQILTPAQRKTFEAELDKRRSERRDLQ
jgi:periplasmic protein CpxP/Spy